MEGDLRLAALMLLGAVAAVLVIACVNLTNLFIARALGRRRETAVRLAIGASRLQVARQFVIESALVTLAGAACGLVVASTLLSAAGGPASFVRRVFPDGRRAGVDACVRRAGLTLVGASMIGLDGTTVLAACATAALMAGLIALIPAMQSSALRPLETLRGGRGATHADRLGGFGARGALVIAQITIALVLLAGAGLMLKSAARLHATAIGVDQEGVLTARVDLPSASYNEERRLAFFSQLADRVRSIPGVESVGLANCPPVSGGCNSTIVGFESRHGKHPARRASASISRTPIIFPQWASGSCVVGSSTRRIARAAQGRPCQRNRGAKVLAERRSDRQGGDPWAGRIS